MEWQIYPAVDLPVYGEADGASRGLNLYYDRLFRFYPYSHCTNQFFCCYHFVGL